MFFLVFLNIKFFCGDILDQSISNPNNLSEVFLVPELKQIAECQVFIKVQCANNLIIEVRNSFLNRFPAFKKNFGYEKIAGETIFTLLSQFSVDSINLFMRIIELECNFSLDLLIETLNFDKKEELLDIHFIMYDLKRICTDTFTYSSISTYKRYNQKEFEKTCQNLAFFAFYVNLSLNIYSLQDLVTFLNERTYPNLLTIITFVFSYLEYKPIKFIFKDFSVYIEFERNLSDCIFETNYSWTLRILINGIGATKTHKQAKIASVIRLIEHIYSCYLDDKDTFKFYICNETINSDHISLIREFVCSKGFPKLHIFSISNNFYAIRQYIETNADENTLYVYLNEYSADDLSEMKIKFGLKPII